MYNALVAIAQHINKKKILAIVSHIYIYFLYSEKNLIINIQNYYIVEINNIYHCIRKSLSPRLCKTGITKNIHHILIT